MLKVMPIYINTLLTTQDEMCIHMLKFFYGNSRNLCSYIVFMLIYGVRIIPIYTIFQATPQIKVTL